jgi:hypothetical protein
VITDPLFYLLATVAVILLGLSKGGFFGLGVMALPLLSLQVPPLRRDHPAHRAGPGRAHGVDLSP